MGKVVLFNYANNYITSSLRYLKYCLIEIKPGSHLWNKHKHKHGKIQLPVNTSEISTRTSTKKRNILLSLVLVLILSISPVWTSISNEHSTQSTLRTRIFHFLVLIFTCVNIVSFCLCLWLFHKCEPGKRKSLRNEEHGSCRKCYISFRFSVLDHL